MTVDTTRRCRDRSGEVIDYQLLEPNSFQNQYSLRSESTMSLISAWRRHEECGHDGAWGANARPVAARPRLDRPPAWAVTSAVWRPALAGVLDGSPGFRPFARGPAVRPHLEVGVGVAGPAAETPV